MNDLTQRPWRLDTAATPVKSGKTWTTGFVYYGVNANDTATIQDSRGVQLVKLTCQSGGLPVGEAYFEPQVFNGLALTQISSGYVEVAIK